jgi:hypothetical protein
MDGNFDWVALLRAFIISLSLGVIGNAITSHVLGVRGRRQLLRRSMVLGGVAMILFLTASIFMVWPSLSEIPRLDNLSRAEAEKALIDAQLVPAARPQSIAGVQADRVVPDSQSLSPGLRVRPGTVVSFGVNVRGQLAPVPTAPVGTPAVTVFQPKSGENIYCAPAPDGVYRCAINGISTGISVRQLQLLLWVRPINPPTETSSWYLQQPGISRLEANGAWSGTAQLGNTQWPAHEGDIVDVAVTAVDEQTAKALVAKGGAVTQDQPVGNISDTASGVIITLKQ